MVKVPLSKSFLERRDAPQKSSESLGVDASLTPRTRQRISLAGREHGGKRNFRKLKRQLVLHERKSFQNVIMSACHSAACTRKIATLR